MQEYDYGFSFVFTALSLGFSILQCYKKRLSTAESYSCSSFQMGALEFKSEAISHLEEVSEAGMEAMAASGTVAVILPTTAYILRLKAPPVRQMIDMGVIVALGTDFNPNAFCLSMVIF